MPSSASIVSKTKADMCVPSTASMISKTDCVKSTASMVSNANESVYVPSNASVVSETDICMPSCASMGLHVKSNTPTTDKKNAISGASICNTADSDICIPLSASMDEKHNTDAYVRSDTPEVVNKADMHVLSSASVISKTHIDTQSNLHLNNVHISDTSVPSEASSYKEGVTQICAEQVLISMAAPAVKVHKSWTEKLDELTLKQQFSNGKHFSHS